MRVAGFCMGGWMVVLFIVLPSGQEDIHIYGLKQDISIENHIIAVHEDGWWV